MPPEDKTKDETIPFYPDHIRTEFYVTVVVFFVIVIIGLVGMYAPVGLGEPADPMNTPGHVKPEWYFLSLYQLLKYIPKSAGAVSPIILVLLLILLPFIDRKPDTSKRSIKIRFVGTFVIVTIMILLTILGHVS